MGRYVKNEYYNGKIHAKVYELVCIDKPTEGEYKDLLTAGEMYTCREVIASNWKHTFAVTFESGGGLPVPKKYFETIPNG
ncbi:hypothetical protein SMD22_01315 (plasmid) [Brevibacillus halotolerans]|nr:hypothetical protein SMD22_01315 [Brevibacillus halotolerans]